MELHVSMNYGIIIPKFLEKNYDHNKARFSIAQLS